MSRGTNSALTVQNPLLPTPLWLPRVPAAAEGTLRGTPGDRAGSEAEAEAEAGAEAGAETGAEGRERVRG